MEDLYLSSGETNSNLNNISDLIGTFLYLSPQTIAKLPKLTRCPMTPNNY